MLTDDSIDGVNPANTIEGVLTTRQLEDVSCFIQSDRKTTDDSCGMKYLSSGSTGESNLNQKSTDDVTNVLQKNGPSNYEGAPAPKTDALTTVARPSGFVKRFPGSTDSSHDKPSEQINSTLSVKDAAEANSVQNDRKLTAGGTVRATVEHSEKGEPQSKTDNTPAISTTKCIVCKKVARPATIYCSDDCIRKHAQCAINQLANRRDSNASGNSNSSGMYVSGQAGSAMAAHSGALQNVGGNEKTKKRTKELFEEVLTMADRKPKVERVNSI